MQTSRMFLVFSCIAVLAIGGSVAPNVQAQFWSGDSSAATNAAATHPPYGAALGQQPRRTFLGIPLPGRSPAAAAAQLNPMAQVKAKMAQMQSGRNGAQPPMNMMQAPGNMMQAPMNMMQAQGYQPTQVMQAAGQVMTAAPGYAAAMATPTQTTRPAAMMSPAPSAYGQFATPDQRYQQASNPTMQAQYGNGVASAVMANQTPFTTDPTLQYSNTAKAKAKVDAQVAFLVSEAIRYEKAGQTDVAIQRYHTALETDPTDFHTLMSFARLKHRIGDMDGAILTYEKVLEDYPNNAVVYNDLGLCYARHDQIEEAISMITRAVEKQPSSHRYRNNLASLYIETDRIDDAVRVLAPMAGDAMARLNVATRLHRRKRNEAAQVQLTEALRLEPNLAPARELLATIQRPTMQAANQMMHVPGQYTPELAPSYENAAAHVANSQPMIMRQSAEMELGNASTAYPNQQGTAIPAGSTAWPMMQP